MRLQNDVVSVPARRVIALLKALDASDARTRDALVLLKGWKFAEDAGSPEAALFEVWWSRYLGPLFKEVALGKTAAAAMGDPDTSVLLDSLEHPQAYWATDAVAKRNWVLQTSLALAWANTSSRDTCTAYVSETFLALQYG